MRAGLLAAFAQINDEGGIKGRHIQLISLDDSYEPDRALKNTLELINSHKVFLLIGEVGTPTSQSIMPLLEQCSIPFFAPVTGAEFLRNPFRRCVINIRASYYQEMEKLTHIACFYQNDSLRQLRLHRTERYRAGPGPSGDATRLKR